jgi:hypothetical protein
MAERMSTGDAQAIATALRTSYTNGVLAIFGGASQPADSDAAETGTLLCLITRNSGAFTAGQATNGLNFDAPVSGVLSKAAAETWSGNGLAAASTGTVATWCRFYSNSYTTGASTSAVRFDGAISAAATAELQLSVTTIVSGSPVTITSFTRTVAKS